MIEVFNNHFQEICKNLTSSKKTFVLGLSGGMDSMALLYLLKNFVENNKKFKIEIFPVIIDHNLRQVSSKEAYEVKKIADDLGFSTNIKKVYSKISKRLNKRISNPGKTLINGTFNVSINIINATKDIIETTK